MQDLHPAMRQIAVFFEGRIAYKRGAAFESCPCTTVEERRAWEDGWVSGWEYHKAQFPQNVGTSGVAADQRQSTAASQT